MERPRKPLTGYFQYMEDIKEETKNMQASERGKYCGNAWNALPEEKKKEYNDNAKALKQKYDEDLKRFYEAHPEEKVKDEELARAKKEKKLQKKEPLGFKPDDKNMKIYYTVAFIKNYMGKHPEVYLPSSASVKKYIGEHFQKVSEELPMWRQKWVELSLEEKQHIKDFHQEWLQAKQL